MTLDATFQMNQLGQESWFAVKVRSRCEEAITGMLRKKQYDVLVPTSIDVRTYSDRTRRVRLAMFPGYLFVSFKEENMLDLLSTDGVQYVLRSGRGFEPISRDELASIRALSRLDTHQAESCRLCSHLEVGQRVTIEAGPLAGLTGTLVRTRDANRLVVSVNSLHSTISVEIGHAEVRLLPTHGGPGMVAQVQLAAPASRVS